jgi:O-antigen/teichoic acid export membrane protein
MNREFLINVLFLVLVNLLVKPFYVFGIERTIQDTVGPASYGLYATLFSFSLLLFMVNDFGIHYFNNTHIARHPRLISKYFPNLSLLKILLGGLYLVLLFLLAWLRGFEPSILPLLFFVALNQLLVSWVAFLRSNVSALGMYRTDSLLSMLDKLLLSGLCALLLWGPLTPGYFRIEWLVYAQGIAWLLTGLAAFFIVKKHLQKPIRLRLRRPVLAFFIKKSAPYALAVFLMAAYTRLDIVLLEWLLPDGRHEAGIYAAAFRLLDAFNAIGLLSAGLLLPMFSSLLKQRDLKTLESLLQTSFQLIWAGSATLALACFFFQTELMHWLYPETATPYYGEVLAFVILTLVPFSGLFIYSTLLTANGSLKKMNFVFLLGIAINLSLNLLLIPEWKAVGAGIAALTTQAAVLAGMVVLVRSELDLKPGAVQFLRVFGFVGLLALANWGISQLPIGSWLLKFCLCLLAGGLLALLLKLVHLNGLPSLIRRAR